VEEEVAAEDVVWAVAVVVAVEEVVVAGASDQPKNTSRTKNNHCLDATSIRNLFVLEKADGQNVKDIVDCVQHLREQDTTPGHTHGQDSLSHRIRPSDRRQKGKSYQGTLRPAQNPGRCFLTFMNFRKRNAISFMIKPYGLSLYFYLMLY